MPQTRVLRKFNTDGSLHTSLPTLLRVQTSGAVNLSNLIASTETIPCGSMGLKGVDVSGEIILNNNLNHKLLAHMLHFSCYE